MAAIAHPTHSAGLIATLPSKLEDYYSQGLRARFKMDGAKLLDAQSAQYAEIGYDVNEDLYQRRSVARLAAGGLPTDVPVGFPKRLEGNLVWDENSFRDESEYIYYLTDSDKEEISIALEYFKKQNIDCQKVSRETFPLPILEEKLNSACSDVYEGRGFCVVRGLDPEAYAVEDLTAVYLGLSSYIAERRGKQDQRGSMLMHVMLRNDGAYDKHASEDKPFHTDTVNDCLCLFARNLAESGGRSVLASMWTVYNELAATRPDLIHVLSQPNWPFDTFGRSPSYYKRALVYHQEGKVIASFSRRMLVGHAPWENRTPGIPGLTEAQAEALDAVHFIARKHEIKPSMQKGDLRFINNMAILHRREAFADGEGSARHLVRIWLNNELRCWKLPYDLRVAWARVFEDPERKKHWDLEPVRKNGKILRVAGSCD